MQSWNRPPVPVVATPPGSARSVLSLFDTASGSVRPTDPGDPATIYVCGITPYDATHIGHAATYVAFDLVQRMWLDGGHRVHAVQNITDIDDPLLERAARDGIDWRDLAAREIDLFRRDMTALRVLPPTDYIGALEAMDEVSAGVQALLDRGAAYRITNDDDLATDQGADGGDVYFDIAAAPHFGQESGYDEETMLALAAERGGDPERPGKRHPLDPLLWRTARTGEPSWASPMGPGRPGWHIECAVIAGKRLGATIDVQGGGSDLIFPHHECSAAHAEVLTGVFPFARHYTHAAMISLDGEKMSKSRGNLVFVSRLLADGVDPMSIRLALLAGHYRTDRPWTAGLLTAAQTRLDRWRAAAGRGGAQTANVIATVRTALANDLDTPAALAALDRWAADDTLDGAAVADAVDALLGVSLR